MLTVEETLSAVRGCIAERAWWHGHMFKRSVENGGYKWDHCLQWMHNDLMNLNELIHMSNLELNYQTYLDWLKVEDKKIYTQK